MLRNKAYRQMLLMLIGITIIGSTIGFLIAPVTGVAVGITSVLITLISLWMTRRRYSDIKELSGYLRRI
ncbi:MAG: hypothetical protein H6Q59_2983, partial [Firmicutes bacterium]|nr:hypothetical protein [Bacillota bacterium]